MTAPFEGLSWSEPSQRLKGDLHFQDSFVTLPMAVIRAIDTAAERITALEAENERLRRTLNDIAGSAGTPEAIAAALERKEA